ncbi:MAG: hypothetical protein IPI43_09595 [Sandaracinaceae bacterium]|nr:hypothetical protein [Sandaracinaceae bacterium]
MALLGWGAAVLVFALLQFTQQGLQQDDPYHLALTERLATGELLTALPWAKHTILAERFADLHFGYHVYLVPFVALLGGPLGGKLGTTVAVAMLLLAVQWIAGREHPWRALLSLLVVPASGVFLLRVMGMRPIAWAAAAVLVVIPLARAQRHGLLALMGAVFAWSYAAFPLLLLPLGAHAVARFATARELAWKPTASVVIGVLLGLALHPNFFVHLDLLAVQLFDVSVDRSGLNLEYASPGLGQLLKEGWLVFVVLAVGVHGAVRAWGTSPEDREELLAWAVVAGLTLLVYVRNERGVDYFVPTAIAFVAVALRRRAATPAPSTAALAFGALLVLGGGAAHAHEAWAQSRRFEAIDPSACATWLARNSQPGDEVFLHDYGAFPRLFYRNDRNVYTLGLDPGFMRAKDPALFHRYLAAVRLERDPYPLIAGTLGARYVYVENTALSRAFYDYLLAHRAQFRPAYRDEFAAVFTVVPR